MPLYPPPSSGSGISNVVEDTSPQLGGNLDIQAFNIEGADAADLLKLSELTATSTELNHVDGVTSAIQTQLDAKQPLDSDLTTIAGLTATTDNFMIAASSAWASRTPAQAKTTLSLNNVDNTSDQIKNIANSIYNVKDYGAVGDNSTNDTSDIQDAIDAAEAAGGGVVYFPEGTYVVDPLTVDSSNVVVRGAGWSSILKLRAQDVDPLANHGVLQIYGTALAKLDGILVEDIAVDGNESNMTGTPELFMEGIDVKYCNGGIIRNCYVHDTISEGIDVDESAGFIIQNNRLIGCGGGGIHNSENNVRTLIIGNYAEGCGFDFSRFGMDQYTNASDSVYVGNVAVANYRNYNITGSGAVFTGNASLGATTADDVLTGAVSLRYNTQHQDNTTNSRGENMITQDGWGFIVGNGTVHISEAVTFGTSFDSEPTVILQFIGFRATADGAPTGPSWFTGALTTTTAVVASPNTVATTGFTANLNRTGGSTLGNTLNWGYQWTAIGKKLQHS